MIAFLMAYAMLAWMLRFVARHSMTLVVVYRLVLGAAIIALLGAGVLSA